MAPFLPGTFQIKKECLACRGAAAVFNMSYFGKFYLVGLDARWAADWLFSADVSRPPGMTSRGPCSSPTLGQQELSGHSLGHETRRQADPVSARLPLLRALPRGLALGPRV